MSYKEDIDPARVACTNVVTRRQSWFCGQSYGNCTNTCTNLYGNCTNRCSDTYVCSQSYGNCTNSYSASYSCSQSYGDYADNCSNYTDCAQSYSNCQNSHSESYDCSQSYSDCENSCGIKTNYYVQGHRWSDTYIDACVNTYNNYWDCSDSTSCSQHYGDCTNNHDVSYSCSESYGDCSNTCSNYSYCSQSYTNCSNSYVNCTNACSNNYNNCTNDCTNYYVNASNDCTEYVDYTNSISYTRYNTGLPNTAPITWSSAHWTSNSLKIEKVNDSEAVFEEIRANINRLNESKGQHTTADASFANPILASLDGKVKKDQYNTLVDNLNTVYLKISGKDLGTPTTAEASVARKAQIELLKAKIDAVNAEDMSARYSNTYTRTDTLTTNYTETRYDL